MSVRRLLRKSSEAVLFREHHLVVIATQLQHCIVQPHHRHASGEVPNLLRFNYDADLAHAHRQDRTELTLVRRQRWPRLSSA